jgi:hypothetical protein
VRFSNRPTAARKPHARGGKCGSVAQRRATGVEETQRLQQELGRTSLVAACVCAAASSARARELTGAPGSGEWVARRAQERISGARCRVRGGPQTAQYAARRGAAMRYRRVHAETGGGSGRAGRERGGTRVSSGAHHRARYRSANGTAAQHGVAQRPAEVEAGGESGLSRQGGAQECLHSRKRRRLASRDTPSHFVRLRRFRRSRPVCRGPAAHGLERAQ